MSRRGRKFPLVLAIVLGFVLQTRAAEQGLIWGRVVAEGQEPLAGARIIILFPAAGLDLRTSSDKSGGFRWSGIPLGTFSVRVESPGFKSYEGQRFVSEPASTFYFDVLLRPKTEKERNSEARVLSSGSNFSQTILSSRAQERLPSGNNIWNLIENQDLSATSNRIDVGGLWTGVPALFSGRGSVSWTQTAYLLNGMDFTDPYRTGTPLFYPDFFNWDFVRLVNANLPVQATAPGAYFDIITPPESPRWHGGLTAFYSDKRLTSTNITPALEKENLTDNDTLRRLGDFNFHSSGPLSGKVSFSAALTSQTLVRHIAQFSPMMSRPSSASRSGSGSAFRTAAASVSCGPARTSGMTIRARPAWSTRPQPSRHETSSTSSRPCGRRISPRAIVSGRDWGSPWDR